MKTFGFSTGALAKGDYALGLELVVPYQPPAVELSALREEELAPLMRDVGAIDVSRFKYVSVHAPSRLKYMKESEVATLLLPCIERGWHVVLHPDAIGDYGVWRDFGATLTLENLDTRRSMARTADEMAVHFKHLPDATFCLDLAHARQVDPTMSIARKMARTYKEKLVQIHLSELNVDSEHKPISMLTVWAIREILNDIPDCPIILESVVPKSAIGEEFAMASRCFSPEPI